MMEFWVISPIFFLLLLCPSFPCLQLPSNMYIPGVEGLQTFCQNQTTYIKVQKFKEYRVMSIDYSNKTIRLIDPGIVTGSCSSLPRYRTTLESALNNQESLSHVLVEECSSPIVEIHSSYNFTYILPTSPCLNSSHANYTSYAVLRLADAYSYNYVLPENCSVVASTIAQIKECVNCTFAELHRHIQRGFPVQFAYGLRQQYYVENSGFLESIWTSIEGVLPTVLLILKDFLITRSSIGAFLMILVIAYKLLRRHLSTDESIEQFLQQYKKSIPKAYPYWQILKMTHNFREKLGKGGFGSVYKGKLPDGQFVAVKKLSDSKGNGQDFINEVATIGRIHHNNIVQLVGFCSAGTRRALIYQYMPNGSLDKHIFSTEEGHSLGWDQLYGIALGVARGIEYLHQGCDMKILHFDIKPHNILLDENLTPKLSDFGLAKYYSADQSLVSVTAMRGTIGYIAPELFYKSSSGVSSKTDVYSFGMLLMEMAGKRKNINPNAQTSQIYFPSWVYNQLLEENKVETLLGVSEVEKEVMKKMLIVGLWCIQMKPIDRPSMTKIVEMLEGSVEDLQMPPKPFLSSTRREDDDFNIILDSSSSSVASDEPLSLHNYL